MGARSPHVKGTFVDMYGHAQHIRDRYAQRYSQGGSTRVAACQYHYCHTRPTKLLFVWFFVCRSVQSGPAFSLFQSVLVAAGINSRRDELLSDRLRPERLRLRLVHSLADRRATVSNIFRLRVVNNTDLTLGERYFAVALMHR